MSKELYYNSLFCQHGCIQALNVQIYTSLSLYMCVCTGGMWKLGQFGLQDILQKGQEGHQQ